MNLEEELISSLCDLKKERKKNKHLKEELSKMKESNQDSINHEETKKVFIDLKVKLEESKMIGETLRKQVEEKERIQVELENEIVSLRGKLQIKEMKYNFENNTKILDQIISIHRSNL
jgi:mannitol-specific phosphotransferase system IIBC component